MRAMPASRPRPIDEVVDGPELYAVQLGSPDPAGGACRTRLQGHAEDPWRSRHGRRRRRSPLGPGSHRRPAHPGRGSGVARAAWCRHRRAPGTGRRPPSPRGTRRNRVWLPGPGVRDAWRALPAAAAPPRRAPAVAAAPEPRPRPRRRESGGSPGRPAPPAHSSVTVPLHSRPCLSPVSPASATSCTSAVQVHR